MPSLKETKDRIVSVNSTRKITSAMKMVASSKLHHAQTLDIPEEPALPVQPVQAAGTACIMSRC